MKKKNSRVHIHQNRREVTRVKLFNEFVQASSKILCEIPRER